MTTRWTSEALCTVLRESAWWERLVRAAATAASRLSGEKIVGCWLGLSGDARAPKCWDPWAKPLAAELYALEAEIKSGAIYGSPAKCAICGGDPHGYERDWWKNGETITVRCCKDHWPCVVCVRDGTGALPAAAAILRARRILAGKQVKPSPLCTMKQSTPPVPKAEPVKCWKCGSADLPNFLLPYSDGMRHDPRRLCSPCHEVAVVWKVRQVSHHQLPPEPDCTGEERVAHRRAVLMGKVRGEDPRLIGTCVGSLDPRDR